MKRKSFIFFVFAMLLLLNSVITTAQDPVTLRIGWAGSPDSLNPGIGVLTESYTIWGMVYDAMYELNLDGSYSLELAESATVSDDGLVWTYMLRDGITFHDGTPLTASDVVFSYTLYQNTAGFAFLPTYTSYFASVEAPDDMTVVITLTEAIPNMESQLVFLFVLPEHIWGDVDNPVDFENAELIGTGPFSLIEYSQNEFVRLAAVKDHYLYSPLVDEIIFQTFDNQDALVQSLRTGQVDMITEMPSTAAVGLRNEENIELVVGPPQSPGVTDIIFNVTEEENCPPDDGICSGHPALLDLTVRRALAHATDKLQIIDVVILGLGNPGTTLIPDGLGIWYNTDLVDYEYNIDMANQMLDDAGYMDTDGDGVREMPDGSQSLVFRMNWPSDSLSAPRMSELLNGMWSQIGIQTELQALDADALTAICCPSFDFDVILWGWGSDPDPSFLLSVMTTDEIPTGTSETGYSNPEYDALFIEQATELDLDRRIELVWDMQRIVHEDLPYIIPYYSANVQAFRTDRFTGWVTDGATVELSDLSSLLFVTPVE